MIQEVCRAMADNDPLPPGGIGAAFADLIMGSATSAQAGAFLYALRMHPLDGDDLATCANILLSHARLLTIPGADRAIDTCGTGGDHAMTFNISTAAAFAAAGAGIPVLKHGNRAVTSRSGSADVLAAFGIRSASSDQEALCFLQNANIAFLSAPNHHPALRKLAGLRTELGFRTIFNNCGPLCHPAGPINRVLGVSDPVFIRPMAEALRLLGVQHALVITGDGIDELSLHGENRICELVSGNITEYSLEAADLGLSFAPVEALHAGSPQESAGIIRRVFEGGDGPCRDIVLLNAAGAIYVGGGADCLSSALTIAERSIDSGRAAECLDHCIDISGGV
ncbi:MAG: anthranilate phosphoribosyltransferase [Methanocalculus sp. MSAO_Arc2]|uniref:anthranilate phosphoribosyltransferase n=1 Tax=Methanocalculus sp. MSAO_Arc2 TaxID=2293855 RepID=UPI000FF01A66|nr:MAG: anthranilate phosphoribosyltransferase [Methanocalculus sp. MSAO_Arc2]